MSENIIRSTDEEVDEPSVMGAAHMPIPTATEEDRRIFKWGAEFVKVAVARGVLDHQAATDLFMAGRDDWDYSDTPEAALEAEMEYWENDGD